MSVHCWLLNWAPDCVTKESTGNPYLVFLRVLVAPGDGGCLQYNLGLWHQRKEQCRRCSGWEQRGAAAPCPLRGSSLGTYLGPIPRWCIRRAAALLSLCTFRSPEQSLRAVPRVMMLPGHSPESVHKWPAQGSQPPTSRGWLRCSAPRNMPWCI